MYLGLIKKLYHFEIAMQFRKCIYKEQTYLKLHCKGPELFISNEIRNIFSFYSQAKPINRLICCKWKLNVVTKSKNVICKQVPRRQLKLKQFEHSTQLQVNLKT